VLSFYRFPLIKIHDCEHCNRLLIGFICFKSFYKSKKLLTLCPFRKLPLPRVSERSYWRKTRLYAFLSIFYSFYYIYLLLRCWFSCNIAASINDIFFILLISSLNLRGLTYSYNLEWNLWLLLKWPGECIRRWMFSQIGWTALNIVLRGVLWRLLAIVGKEVFYFRKIALLVAEIVAHVVITKVE
jgi:hypothetical protein